MVLAPRGRPGEPLLDRRSSLARRVGRLHSRLEAPNAAREVSMAIEQRLAAALVDPHEHHHDHDGECCGGAHDHDHAHGHDHDHGHEHGPGCDHKH